MLRYLEDKGQLRHEEDGPALRLSADRRHSATCAARPSSHVVRTFFDGSVSTAVAALLETRPLSRDEYERLSRLLEDASAKEDEA